MYHLILVAGNLGRDPEMRFTPSGQAVTNFSLASNRTYTGSDGAKVKETIWFNITVWGAQAESCNNYLQKGSKVLVEGRLNPDENGGPRIWNKKDGTPAAAFEVTANTVRFLDGRSDSQSAEQDGEDEVPF